MQLLEIVAEPDNAPILLLLALVPVLAAFWWRRAAVTDAALASGRTPRDAVLGDDAAFEDPLFSWPFLVRIELVAAVLCCALLIVWSVFLDAPLQPRANPNLTPNPSKAPWYFQGLQELLVYFDPWIAGVAVPVLIIVGLIAIPYVDPNPRGGYYSWKERRFAISVFALGFGLWVALMGIGTLVRGPGWGWFWPGQRWDHTRVATTPTVDLPEFLTGGRVAAGSREGFAIGATLLVLFYGAGLALPWLALRRRSPAVVRALGPVRYLVVAFLGTSMLLVIAKIVLRLAFSVKYVLVTGFLSI